MNNILYHLTNRGTFSEINNFLIVKIYADRINAHFLIDDRCWSGASNINNKYPRGLREFFDIDDDLFFYKYIKLPSIFNNSTIKGSRILNLVKMIVNGIRKKIISIQRNFHDPNMLLTYEVWHMAKLLMFSPYVDYSDRIVYSKDIISETYSQIFKYKEYLASFIKINSENLSLKFGGEKYIGCHIRKGDKVNNEMGSIPLKVYAEEILKTKIVNVFISTDSYVSYLEICKILPSHFNVFTFSMLTSNGFDLNNFTTRTGEEKKIEMMMLFSDVELLVNSEIFIGTYSSCLSQFVGARRMFKKSISVDTEWQFT